MKHVDEYGEWEIDGDVSILVKPSQLYLDIRAAEDADLPPDIPAINPIAELTAKVTALEEKLNKVEADVAISMEKVRKTW